MKFFILNFLMHEKVRPFLVVTKIRKLFLYIHSLFTLLETEKALDLNDDQIEKLIEHNNLIR